MGIMKENTHIIVFHLCEFVLKTITDKQATMKRQTKEIAIGTKGPL
jgi:hypothetical protein